MPVSKGRLLRSKETGIGWPRGPVQEKINKHPLSRTLASFGEWVRLFIPGENLSKLLSWIGIGLMGISVIIFHINEPVGIIALIVGFVMWITGVIDTE